jgi:hypothetical protein
MAKKHHTTNKSMALAVAESDSIYARALGGIRIPASMTPETAFYLMCRAVEINVAREEEELFGDSEDCTDDEAEIIFSSKLTHAEKVAALKVLRGEVAPSCESDAIYARSLGVRLT